jgi:hypothetical protein
LIYLRDEHSGEKIGWALSNTETLEDGMTEIRSKVRFDRLPLKEALGAKFLDLLSNGGGSDDGAGLRIDTVMTIDTLDRLAGFRTTVRFDHLDSLIKLIGSVEDNQLTLDLRTDLFETPGATPGAPLPTLSLPNGALTGEKLSPRTQLPGLRLGQNWTVPTYSPLPWENRMEFLQAKVVRNEPVLWNGGVEHVWVVEYRKDFGSVEDEPPLGQLWVHPDGAVLKQQVALLDTQVTFLRMSRQQAAEWRRRVPDEP